MSICDFHNSTHPVLCLRIGLPSRYHWVMPPETLLNSDEVGSRLELSLHLLLRQISNCLRGSINDSLIKFNSTPETSKIRPPVLLGLLKLWALSRFALLYPGGVGTHVLLRFRRVRSIQVHLCLLHVLHFISYLQLLKKPEFEITVLEPSRKQSPVCTWCCGRSNNIRGCWTLEPSLIIPAL